MKKNRIFGALSAAALLFAGACSNDVIDPNKQGESNVVKPEDGVFIAVNFDLPTAKGTRSYTDGDNQSSGGTEVGTEDENMVQSTLLVLATYPDNEFIAAAVADKDNITPLGTTGRSYRSVSQLTKTDLNDYYQQLKELNVQIDQATGNHKVNVFVFCNPINSLMDVFGLRETDDENQQSGGISIGDKDWVNKLGHWEEPNLYGSESIWTPGRFLMANCSICTRLMPSDINGWDDFSTDASAFNLSGMNNYGRPNEIDNYLEGNGAIEVERAAARYDFRDGALDTAGADPQTYNVLLDTDENPLINVYLGKMSMVNMNKDFFFLRRVSNNGRAANVPMPSGEPNDYRILGPELPWYTDALGNYIQGEDGNYVVDVWSGWKWSGTGVFDKGGYSNYFNYPFFNDDNSFDNKNEGGIKLDEITGDWYTSLISDVLNGKNKDQSGKYTVWRYLTEGTIPGPGAASQKNGVSNGIAFKGLIQPARVADASDDDFTKKLLEITKPTNANKTSEEAMSDPILFLYANHMYATWDHIRRTAISLAINLTYHSDEGGKGSWTFTTTRSSNFYNAVFGNGGFGTVTFKVLDELDENGVPKVTFLTTQTEGEDIVTITDPTAQDVNSPNYLYQLWRKSEPVQDELFYDFREACRINKIALYTTSFDEQIGKWGYYCNYYYWNRHNDNGQNGVMGPMEFAVVRNNVYKLAVTKLSRIGHPQDPKNDPDVPTPDTDDESGDVYIAVTCTVLPWVVRENNIEF
ncbi:MAG: Mfa1 fimbrilin C-terminal domain-containing protein [Muribaculaceae bacterium]|nr:Mfa1 fimbrilin C-terminal domain-containing protein [Muribaculaceae bacterium]